MYNYQRLFLSITAEYTRQINQILNMAAMADKKQIMQLTFILNKLKSSLQKLQRRQPQFKKCTGDPAKYESLLKPYISFLESTKVEIERLQK